MATRSLAINTETIFPAEVHSWTIERDGNRIYATTTSRANGACEKVWEFPFKIGTLHFYNGNDNAYCYFRDDRFSEFMKKHGLTAVKRADPNRTYSGESHCGGHGTMSHDIRTDGNIEEVRTGGRFDDYEGELGNACYSGQYDYRVTGATWVIWSEVTHYRDNHSSASILYTLDNVYKLKNI